VKVGTVLEAVRAALRVPVRKVAPNGVREAVVLAAARLLGVAHRTNPSGNNMSQR